MKRFPGICSGIFARPGIAMIRKRREPVASQTRPIRGIRQVESSLSCEASFEFRQGHTPCAAFPVGLPAFIQNLTMGSADWHAVINAGKPQFLRELKSLAFGQPDQCRVIRKFHGDNLFDNRIRARIFEQGIENMKKNLPLYLREHAVPIALTPTRRQVFFPSPPRASASRANVVAQLAVAWPGDLVARESRAIFRRREYSSSRRLGRRS
jgi:hypothetical protein